VVVTQEKRHSDAIGEWDLRRLLVLPILAHMFSASKNRRGWMVALGLLGLYLVLLFPDRSRPVPSPAVNDQPFVWQRDELWQALEANFRSARDMSSADRTSRFNEKLERVRHALDLIAQTNLPPDAEVFDALEGNFFQLAVFAAVNPERNGDFMQAATRFAQLAKRQAEAWSPESPEARQRLYRLLFGRRAAVEEVMLQIAPAFDPLERIAIDEVAATPSVEIHGVRVHSGDILVSRGGAATSALISRGNDYRGNFSHVALVQVDEVTQAASIIESHIASGVGVRPITEYLADTKLRIMVLRLRADLPVMQANPQLPHHAATAALSNSLARHIPYDFAMEHTDPARQFCSEVVSSAYLSQGLTLWSGLSQISEPGLRRWLTTLGVRNFASQQPSDLEYDPQISVIAEWRNPETLWQDHLDNAVIDALLETAERGAELDYNLWLLPPMRLLKTGCWVWNQFGGTGPIPEGMSATTALRVDRLKVRHAAARERLKQAAAQFQHNNGYVAPYWELVRLARESIE
jgi:hypothetical protein